MRTVLKSAFIAVERWRVQRLPRRRVARSPPQEAANLCSRRELLIAVSDCLPDEFWPPLDLLEDLDQVLSKDRDGEQIEAAKKHDENDDGRDSKRYFRVAQPVDHLIGEGEKGERRHRRRCVPEELNRQESERKDGLFCPPYVLQPTVGRTPEDPFR